MCGVIVAAAETKIKCDVNKTEKHIATLHYYLKTSKQTLALEILIRKVSQGLQ